MIVLLSCRKCCSAMQPASHGAVLYESHENAQTISRVEEPMENYGEMR
jgi:hypothetical protein